MNRDMKKKFLTIAIIIGFFMPYISLAGYAETPYQGHVEETDVRPKNLIKNKQYN